MKNSYETHVTVIMCTVIIMNIATMKLIVMTFLYHQRCNNIAQESRECFFRTMSSVLVLGAHAAIDSLIQSSLESKHKFEWVSNSDITDIKSSQIDNVYYAIRKRRGYKDKIMLLSLGSNEECTPTLMSD